MVHTITINDTTYNYSTAFAWMIKYKSQFQHDVSEVIIDAVISSQQDTTGLTAISKIGFVTLSRITWACIAVVDKTIAPYDTWINSLDDFPVLDVATELLPNVFASFTAKKK